MILLEYTLALLGTTLLCALWMGFQLWLKRIDPQRDDYKPGCGACQGASCGSAPGAPETGTTETTIKLEKLVPGQHPDFRGNPFGENECVEKKSPS
jgi:hypothetical protein